MWQHLLVYFLIFHLLSFSPVDICVQEASVFHRPAQPVPRRHPPLSEGLPAVGRALPGHRAQLHLRLRPGAEWRRRLSEPRRPARQHAHRAAPVPHQKNKQVLLSGPDERRGARVCGVMEAESSAPCRMSRATKGSSKDCKLANSEHRGHKNLTDEQTNTQDLKHKHGNYGCSPVWKETKGILKKKEERTSLFSRCLSSQHPGVDVEVWIHAEFIKDLLWRTKNHSELQTKDEKWKHCPYAVAAGGEDEAL